MSKTKNHYNNRKDQHLSIDTIGKIMPQAVELEEAVLGALLTEGKAWQEVDDILKADDFYKESHRSIFKAINRLSSNREPIDMLTVVEQLKKDGELENIGGPMYIVELTSKVASSAHIEYHCRIIKQKALARNLINITSVIQSKAYDDSLDIGEVMEDMEKSFTELVSGSVGCQSISTSDALAKAIELASKSCYNNRFRIFR